MKRLFILLALCTLCFYVQAAVPRTNVQKLAERLDREEPFGNSIWGICAVNVKGDTIVSLNSRRRMVPASNMKLLTTGAALVSLGADYTFKTSFGYTGSIVDSVLVGDLYVIGGGDPTIGNLFSYLPSASSTFGKWLAVLRGAGIKRIEGNVIGDGSYFDGNLRHTDWSSEDERTKDGVVPAGLTWRGKMGDPMPDGPLAAVSQFVNWLSSADTSFTVSGKALQGKAPSAEVTVLHAPEGYRPDSLVMLGSVPSPQLRSLIRTANYESDNFTAETLLKALGLKFKGASDYTSATSALHRGLSPLGVATASTSMRFADGSGLSRKNYVSPAFFVSFLRAMARHAQYKTFLNSIPKLGSGTLKTRMKDSPKSVKDRVYMKSGSMNGVRCFSGYILAGDGNPSRTICFSVLTNNAVASSSKTAQVLDNLIETLALENQ